MHFIILFSAAAAQLRYRKEVWKVEQEKIVAKGETIVVYLQRPTFKLYFIIALLIALRERERSAIPMKKAVNVFPAKN